MSKEEDQKPLPKQPESQELYGDSEIVVEFDKIQDRDFAQEVQEIAESFPQEIQDSYEFKENLRRNVQNILDLQEMHGEINPNDQELQGITEQIEDFETVIYELEEQKILLEQSGKNPEKISSIDSQIENLEEQLSELESQKEELEQRVVGLEIAPDLEIAKESLIGNLLTANRISEITGKFPEPEYIDKLENFTPEELQQEFDKLSKSLPDQQPTAQEAEPAVSDNLTPSEQAKSAKRMAAIEAMEKGEQKTEQEQKPELEFQQKAREFKENFSKSDLAKLEAVKQELQEQAAKAPADRRASQTINQNKGQGQGAGSQQSR